MSRNATITTLVFAMAVVLTGCATTTADTTDTPSATAEEMEIFCARHDEVKNLSFEEKHTALLEVAPAEIEPELFRLVNGPSDGWFEDGQAVDEFIERCNDL